MLMIFFAGSFSIGHFCWAKPLNSLGWDLKIQQQHEDRLKFPFIISRKRYLYISSLYMRSIISNCIKKMVLVSIQFSGLFSIMFTKRGCLKLDRRWAIYIFAWVRWTKQIISFTLCLCIVNKVSCVPPKTGVNEKLIHVCIYYNICSSSIPITPSIIFIAICILANTTVRNKWIMN